LADRARLPPKAADQLGATRKPCIPAVGRAANRTAPHAYGAKGPAAPVPNTSDRAAMIQAPGRHRPNYHPLPAHETLASGAVKLKRALPRS
jgi:hypothetical protein